MADEQNKLPTTPDPEHAKNLGRVDFKETEFDRAIEQHGAEVTWEKSMLCSCYEEHSGQPDFTCPACKGLGYLYFDPEVIRVVSSGLNGSKDQLPIGLLEVGSATMTARAKHRIGFRDRVVFNDCLTPYSQFLKYEDAPVKLKFKAEEIVAVKVLDTDIPKDKYKLSDDKTHIVFEDGILQYGEQFSVLIRMKPRYIVLNIPHELRGQYIKFGRAKEEWVELPKMYLIKREDFMPDRPQQ